MSNFKKVLNVLKEAGPGSKQRTPWQEKKSEYTNLLAEINMLKQEYDAKGNGNPVWATKITKKINELEKQAKIMKNELDELKGK